MTTKLDELIAKTEVKLKEAEKWTEYQAVAHPHDEEAYVSELTRVYCYKEFLRDLQILKNNP